MERRPRTEAKKVNEVTTREELEARLPKITLTKKEPKRETRGSMRNDEYEILNTEGEVVGTFTLHVNIMPPALVERRGNGSASMNTVEVTHTGQGFGTAAYLQVIDMLKQDYGIQLESGYQLSESSLALWERLVRINMAEMIEEGETEAGSEEAGYSSARFKAL